MPHRLIATRYPRTASLDKALVMAAWWTVTRSMVLMSVVLGSVLIVVSFREENSRAYAFLHSPLWMWGSLLVAFALLWLVSQRWLCVLAGVLVGVWYQIFATAFLLAFLEQDPPGSTPSGIVTYMFMGWFWYLVTYVVWRDERHIRAELAQLTQEHVAAPNDG